MMRPTGHPSVIFTGIGAYAPQRILTNDELSQQVDTSDEWIRTRSGIRERRIAADGETTSDMATIAGQRAIAAAGLQPEDIDLLVVGTMSPDMPFPSTACIVQHKLGLRTIPAFDVSAACSGFLYILEVASSLIKAGTYRHALIIGAEKMSGLLDWQDRTTCVLFGDGAGACVLSRSDQPGVGILDTQLGSDGSNPSLLYMPAGGSACPPSYESVAARQHYLKMNGREVFKLAVRGMENACRQLLEENQVCPDSVRWIIPHQANSRIIDTLADRLALPAERFVINLDRFGNTSAASIPIAMQEAWQDQRIQSGDLILLTAFGAGLTWGATLLKWQ